MIPDPLRHLLFLLVTAALGLISIRSSAAELPPDVAVASLGSWTAPPESPAPAVVRENELTYVAVGNAGLLVLDISDPTAPALAGS